MNYRIEYLGFGFTAWQGYTIKNVEKYKDKSNIPTFNTDDAPLTEGLKLLEKGGKIKIVNLDKVEEPTGDEKKVDEPVDNEDEEPVDEPTEEEKEIEDAAKEAADKTLEEAAKDEVEEDAADEVDSTVEVKINTVEFDGQEVELDEKALDDAFTSTDLDDLCKEKEISGYSKLNKDDKIKLIIEELA
jgi:hypothetical protein